MGRREGLREHPHRSLACIRGSPGKVWGNGASTADDWRLSHLVSYSWPTDQGMIVSKLINPYGRSKCRSSVIVVPPSREASLCIPYVPCTDSPFEWIKRIIFEN